MSRCMKYIISRRPLLAKVIIIKKKIKKAVLVLRKKDVRSSHRPACSHGISRCRGLENGEDLGGVKDHGSIGTGVMGHFDIWTQQDRHRRIDRGPDALTSWRHTSSWPFVPWQPVALRPETVRDGRELATALPSSLDLQIQTDESVD